MGNIKQNKMEVMPVGKLLLSMGIPMIILMVLQAVYNIVDSALIKYGHGRRNCSERTNSCISASDTYGGSGNRYRRWS